MSEKRSVKHVTFYNSAYGILFDDGSWSSEGLCKKLLKKMERNNFEIEFLSIGPNNQWFFRLKNGKVFYDVDDDDLRDNLDDPRDRPYKLWFNDDNGYILQYDDLSLVWDNIPQILHNKLNGRQKSLPKVEHITFGTDDTWWVSFMDGERCWSSHIPSNIGKQLKRTEFLVMDSADGNNYFLIKDDGHLHWRADDDFDNDINEDDGIIYVDSKDIHYTQSSISNRFSNGQFIEELRQNLEDGHTRIDDIPPIEVVKTRSGNYWSLNNRRLWCFVNARNIDEIPVRIVDKRPHWFDGRIQQLQDSFNIRIRGESESDSDDSDYSNYH